MDALLQAISHPGRRTVLEQLRLEAGHAAAPWETRWHELSPVYSAMAAEIDRAERA